MPIRFVQHFANLSGKHEFCAVLGKKVPYLIEMRQKRCKKHRKKF